jgi:hypothetical protein
LEETTMIMVLPFVMGLIAALFAFRGYVYAALGTGLATVLIQVWWLIYHSTDHLAITL